MSHKREHKLFIPVSLTTALILDVSSVILNGLIGYVVKKHKKTNVVTFWFIYCLSCTDVLVGITGLLYHSLELTLCVDPSRSFWVLLQSIASNAFDYFLSMSGHLVFIIAIDRCIHMKYLHKYSTLMTEIRSRLLLLVTLFLATMFLVLPFLLTKSQQRVFQFCKNIFYAFCTVVIYATYTVAYFSIKRQVAALQLRRADQVVIQDNLEIGSIYRDRSLCEHHHKECRDLKEFKSTDNNNGPGSSNPCINKDTKLLKFQNKTLILADYTDTNNKEYPDVCRNAGNISNVVENASIHPVGKANLSSSKLLACKQTRTFQNSDNNIHQGPKRARSKTEQEFRKATLLILCALSICYCPRLVHRFYAYATQDKSAAYYLLTGISVLLNSSLNAIVLITCSKEIQRHIKEIFVQN